MSSPASAQAANDAAKKDLITAIQRKRTIDKSLANIEAKIYAFEGSYLEESASTGGNVVKGFDGYLKSTAPTGNKRKVEVHDSDRLFSSSSLSWGKSLEMKGDH